MNDKSSMWVKLGFLLWFLALSVPLSMMMGSHLVPLNATQNSMQDLPNKKDSWTVMHFLNPDCGCSERVFKSLQERDPKTQEVHEQVFVLGEKPEWVRELKSKGFDVVQGSMDGYAEKYSINAVPQLVILSSKNEVLYAGGYSSKRGPAGLIEDEEIFKEAKSDTKAKVRPIYGCVNGSKNRADVDIVGAKY